MAVNMKMLFLGGLVVATVAFATVDYEFEKSLKDILAQRKGLSYMKNMIHDLDSRLENLQKRTCFLNAGMSHSCDYRDLVSAVDEQKFWASENSPGRRRRSVSSLTFNTPKTGAASRVSRFLHSLLPSRR
ncbi:uncharacterized protein LOC111085612 [Limulus polyphemus]|uniref:Uncharacterized protein LOC111085612 n=1 Tax=Limulus polyphemus TaxID=6850 RepID=A0ABM1SAU5_LIMPO|nr:uncharacterized protein LOC111085612 [Limulus polyphemus]